MNEEHPTISPSIRSHRQQLFWQIIFPFILVAILLIVTAVWIAFFGEAQPNSQWRDISIIWLFVPMLMLALLLMILLGFMIYGLARLKKILPRVTWRAQELTLQGAEYTRKIADGIAKPVIWIEQAKASLRSIFKHQRRL